MDKVLTVLHPLSLDKFRTDENSDTSSPRISTTPKRKFSETLFATPSESQFCSNNPSHVFSPEVKASDDVKDKINHLSRPIHAHASQRTTEEDESPSLRKLLKSLENDGCVTQEADSHCFLSVKEGTDVLNVNSVDHTVSPTGGKNNSKGRTNEENMEMGDSKKDNLIISNGLSTRATNDSSYTTIVNQAQLQRNITSSDEDDDASSAYPADSVRNASSDGMVLESKLAHKRDVPVSKTKAKKRVKDALVTNIKGKGSKESIGASVGGGGGVMEGAGGRGIDAGDRKKAININQININTRKADMDKTCLPHDGSGSSNSNNSYYYYKNDHKNNNSSNSNDINNTNNHTHPKSKQPRNVTTAKTSTTGPIKAMTNASAATKQTAKGRSVHSSPHVSIPSSANPSSSSTSSSMCSIASYHSTTLSQSSTAATELYISHVNPPPLQLLAATSPVTPPPYRPVLRDPALQVAGGLRGGGGEEEGGKEREWGKECEWGKEKKGEEEEWGKRDENKGFLRNHEESYQIVHYDPKSYNAKINNDNNNDDNVDDNDEDDDDDDEEEVMSKRRKDEDEDERTEKVEERGVRRKTDVKAKQPKIYMSKNESTKQMIKPLSNDVNRRLNVPLHLRRDKPRKSDPDQKLNLDRNPKSQNSQELQKSISTEKGMIHRFSKRSMNSAVQDPKSRFANDRRQHHQGSKSKALDPKSPYHETSDDATVVRGMTTTATREEEGTKGEEENGGEEEEVMNRKLEEDTETDVTGCDASKTNIFDNTNTSSSPPSPPCPSPPCPSPPCASPPPPTPSTPSLEFSFLNAPATCPSQLVGRPSRGQSNDHDWALRRNSTPSNCHPTSSNYNSTPSNHTSTPSNRKPSAFPRLSFAFDEDPSALYFAPMDFVSATTTSAAAAAAAAALLDPNPKHIGGRGMKETRSKGITLVTATPVTAATESPKEKEEERGKEREKGKEKEKEESEEQTKWGENVGEEVKSNKEEEKINIDSNKNCKEEADGYEYNENSSCFLEDKSKDISSDNRRVSHIRTNTNYNNNNRDAFEVTIRPWLRRTFGSKDDDHCSHVTNPCSFQQSNDLISDPANNIKNSLLTSFPPSNVRGDETTLHSADSTGSSMLDPNFGSRFSAPAAFGSRAHLLTNLRVHDATSSACNHIAFRGSNISSNDNDIHSSNVNSSRNSVSYNYIHNGSKGQMNRSSNPLLFYPSPSTLPQSRTSYKSITYSPVTFHPSSTASAAAANTPAASSTSAAYAHLLYPTTFPVTVSAHSIHSDSNHYNDSANDSSQLATFASTPRVPATVEKLDLVRIDQFEIQRRVSRSWMAEGKRASAVGGGGGEMEGRATPRQSGVGDSEE